MERAFRIVVLWAWVIALAGCAASGPKYEEMQSAIPALDAKLGRIFFFRPASAMGAAIQPSILLNDAQVGSSVPGGFFYLDVAPGQYTVSTATEVERRIRFTLRPGQTRYVRTQVTMGFAVGQVTPELVEEETALAGFHDLSYTGSALTGKATVAPAGAQAAGPAAAATAASAAAASPAPTGASSRAATAGQSRLPSPGDTWKYRQSKPGQGGGREHVVQMKSAGGGTLVDDVAVAGQAPVENNHSRGVYLVNQGVSLFSPYLNVLGPLASSSRIDSQDDIACPQGVNCLFEAAMAGNETIKVPAGEFNTRKMRYIHSWQYHRFGSGARVVTMWYADDVKRVVKVSSRAQNGSHVAIETDYDLELVEYHLK